ncbi:MAG: glutamate-5-semialdehyde dehydrogenase [Prevotella sp.]|nr:glutamate-5-semialdehyde dehydrogenase [Prevotella sp.]
MLPLFLSAKQASHSLQLLTDAQRNTVLQAVADAIIAHTDDLLAANATDLARMDKANPMYDRLLLNADRLQGIADDMRHVATLPSPLGRTLKEKTLPNGLHLRRVSVPFGVIGMIYEARPNVTFDVFSLCFKSGNACVLKGGKDAEASCRAGVSLIKEVLRQQGIDPSAIELLPFTHEATGEMLTAVDYIDLCIPRGGKRLIQFVRDNAKVPVIETGAGVVHCYFDQDGDLDMGRRIILNAKTRRPSVCNALDCIIIHASRLADLPALVAPLGEKGVRLHADERAYQALIGRYPSPLLLPVNSDDVWNTEWLSLQAGVKTVDSLDEALQHIATYGSGHSESIVTNNQQSAKKFEAMVDAACVYVNAPTSFTDGAQFGLGAEIGISTQKLGARGPMALEEITTYKWLIEGNGQIRS